MRSTLFGAFLLFACLSACEVPFSPKGDFRDYPAVYAILTDQSPNQFVRLYRSYNPSGFDPLEYPEEESIRNAVVVVSDGLTRVMFSETTIVRRDTSRYKSLIHAYGASLNIRKGAEYDLDIRTTEGKLVSAGMTVPGEGTVAVSNPSVLFNPTINTHSSIIVSAVLSPPARGFRVRLFVAVDVLENGIWTPEVREIPRKVPFNDTSLEQWEYHELTRRTTEGTGDSREVTVFYNDAYRKGLGAIKQEFSGKQVRWKEVVFVLAQVDLHLYNYYNIARAFRDPYSLRVDEPDYTNIIEGVGVFGAIVHDSAIVAYPPNTVF